ncbi:cadherin-like beta sandwich domain-containing protein [Cohnella pontilimi]|uniref:cadherin-like beta sandwich domain-containing protein n=1 Tax=Cohnella pontilimi TaxID=2564100 RepID=UPI00145D09F5|nr:cadherin-like beta sandwich domain-containing protein [Cohnella pontilimi]
MKVKLKARKSFAAFIILSLIFNGFMAIGVSNAASGPTTRDFEAVNDFFVDNSGNYPNGDPYNPKSGNWVGSAADPAYGEAQSAVKFDLSSIPGTVTVSKAEFSIYVNSVLGNPTVYKLWGSSNDAWNDSQPTMISKDQLLQIYNGPFNTTSLSQGRWITLDVTGFVQNQMAPNDKKVSFVLTGDPSGDASFVFNSKESTDSQSNIYGFANHPKITMTYTTKSNNADLNGLSLSSGTLSPAFAPGTTSYTATVNSAVASVNVIPIVADNTATVKVNGASTASGTPVPISLNTGPNTITVDVTAEDGTTKKTYFVMVTRLPSSNADLSNLTISAGTLSPAFSPFTTSYTASVDYSVFSIFVTPTMADSTASVKVNGSPTPSGYAVNVPLNVGSNTITVTVTAQDGTTQKNYNITVNRAPSSNANLSNLALSSGTLSPAFSPFTTSYTTSVGNNVSSIAVTPSVADNTASVKVNGSAAAGGSAVTVPLNVGSNTITVTVTAQDGMTQKTYTVTVIRALSSNADLSNLTLSTGTLSPAFASGTTSYTASVANSVSSITVTPTVADSAASVKVNGNTATSGSAVTVPLEVGANTITVLVTAQDGTTQKTYTVTVTRAASSNANLSNLTISVGTLSPAFASGTTSYTASVANSVSSIAITPTVADSTASVKVNGNAATSGSAVTVPLAVGANTITVLVTAQDGTTQKTYTVTVNRAASSNANLKSLTISSGTLTPAFASGTTSYTASVANSVSSIDFTPTVADSTASIKVNGNATASGTAVTVPLNVGPNTIAVLVTAQNGTTQKTYTVTVTRAPSTNADLSTLTISHGVLSPVFAPGTFSYSVSIDSDLRNINITPTAADSTAAIKVNGITATSGSAVTVALKRGTNIITVLMTAQDGTTQKTYTVTVNRSTTL